MIIEIAETVLPTRDQLSLNHSSINLLSEKNKVDSLLTYS